MTSSTCFTKRSEGCALGLGLGLTLGLSGFGLTCSLGGCGGAIGWFTTGDGGADNSIEIIGNGAAAENGSGAGRVTYQNSKPPCSKAATITAKITAAERR
ncbi:hypothetical protein [Methylicorpusculum sp.]|uniref:hypothetical protein n=1 Tax=Methylicorpusculum sp. TaxID=2713644 RepID=UPI00272EFA5B|nr:hypothetical protein [Methylicorpusculum sp.]MDP3528230.1 hypothetical protein [Methylicorpusculum sp.]